MYISLADSRTRGFKKWSSAHRPDNDDDSPGGATPIAIVEPTGDDRPAAEEQVHRPWLVPGVGASF
ncbi:MAG TPA: hypothetical protein VFA12_15085 [Stellaceae bacterium]|jgi:hypothetical protein|nr:hypothetical protein [Stellaceae bacterium]